MVSWPVKWRRASVAKTTLPSSPQVAETPQFEETKQYDEFQRSEEDIQVPEAQAALLLHGIRQPYALSDSHAIPTIRHGHELLVKVSAIGLNPIDWKAPDFNFGIPTLPYIAGRELVGTVIQPPSSQNSRIRKGDLVIVSSTDYRDLRKAAFQEYTIASSFNTIRLPHHISAENGSILGVAFVSAVLALGICMGVNFKDVEDGPDLLEIVRGIDAERLPVDIRKECLEGIDLSERARQDDFLVIWGGSSTCAHSMTQLARLAGLKIISVVDSRKHGLRLSSHPNVRPDLLVDSHDPDRAISVLRAATNRRARFGFDTLGKDTAAHLIQSLSPTSDAFSKSPQDSGSGIDSKFPTPPSTPAESSESLSRSHVIGLTGLPKTNIPDDVALHSVPIKLFHEIPEVGEALSTWCERLLVKGLLVPPGVVGKVEGLEGINGGLDRLRKREISGGRLVATLS